MANRNKTKQYRKMNRPYPSSHNVGKTTSISNDENDSVGVFIKQQAQSLRRDIEQAQLLSKISASNGMYQPILSERILQNINFNPKVATSQDIETWLMNPQQNDSQLRGLSQYLEYTVGQYQKAMHYYVDMLSFNYMILPADSNTARLAKTDKQAYLNSYYRACDKVSRMNIKNTFKGMGLTIMQDGVSFWYKVETETSTSFLPIPTDYCRITSKWDRGWMGEVNLAFFDRMYGLQECLPELSDAYEVFLEKRKEGLSGEALAPFQYYPLPVEKTWIFSFDLNKAVKVPPLSSSMSPALDVLSYRNLLKDQAVLDLNRVIALKIPTKKSGDSLLLEYEPAADIVDMITGNLPENIAAFATPFDPTTINTNQVSSVDKTIQMSNDNMYSSLGMSGTFFGMDTKSAKGLQINQTKDFLFSSTPIYAQFNNMVNWFLSLDNSKYKWKVNFFGNSINSSEEINTALKLVTSSNFPVSYLASTVGFEPNDFEGLVNLEESLGLKEKLKPLVSQFQAGKDTGKTTQSEEAGRPKESLSQLTDEGSATRDTRGISE